MQRNRPIPALIILICVGGCRRSTNEVYVDLDRILQRAEPVGSIPTAVPSPPATRPELTESILGAPGVSLADPATAPSLNVQQMFKDEQAKALVELQRRLRQLYHGEVQGFQLQRERGIVDSERKAYAEADAKYRTLFENWANERAQKVYKLALLAGFPDPNPTSKPSDKPLAAELERRSQAAKKLRTELARIDARFEAEGKAALSAVADKTRADQAALKRQVDAFASDMDKKAEDEARSQIRQAVSRLEFQLSASTPIILPPSPARHLSIPAEPPFEPAPNVNESGILGTRADRRRLLENELRIWLALNRLTLSGDQKGRRDVTEEFEKWREQHGAGP